jgi:hypothetical protein
MIQLTWQTLAWIVLGLFCLRGIVQGIINLYVYIYKSGYVVGRTSMEQEDTAQLLKAIAEVKSEMPEAELALVTLFDKLTGKTKETPKKEKTQTPIGFGLPEKQKEEKDA